MAAVNSRANSIPLAEDFKTRITDALQIVLSLMKEAEAVQIAVSCDLRSDLLRPPFAKVTCQAQRVFDRSFAGKKAMTIHKQGKLSAAQLRAALHYDKETGIFTWRDVTFNVRRGGRAGFPQGDGYRGIKINRHRYSEHRLAWLYMTGSWPLFTVDHRNGNRSDNRWRNLRSATWAQNQANRNVKAGASGLKGVVWEQNAKNKWRASIRMGGTTQRLGNFSCPAAAHFAYVIAADKQYGEFAPRP